MTDLLDRGAMINDDILIGHIIKLKGRQILVAQIIFDMLDFDFCSCMSHTKG